MSYTVNKVPFVGALAHLSAAAHTRGSELSRCVLMEVSAGMLRLSLQADLGMSLLLPVQVDIMAETPPVAVPVALVHDLARNMGAREIHIEVRQGAVMMSSGSNTVEVKPVDTTEEDRALMRPDFTHGTAPVALSVADLKTALDATRYASSSEAFQAVMRGLLIEFGPDRVRFVASDGYRLGLADLEASSQHTFVALPMTRLLIPALKVLEGSEHCAVSVFEGRLILRTATASVSVPMIDGTYPDYSRIVPSESGKTMTLPAAALSASISRISVMSDKNNNNRVQFLIDTDGKWLRVTGEGDYGRGVDMLSMTPGGLLEPMDVGFNSKYMLEALASCKGDVTLDFGMGPRLPVRITSQARGVVAVVVPLCD